MVGSCGVSVGVLWAGAEECGSSGAGAVIVCGISAACIMTSTDRNDLMPAQEKLEWVTPKISLMDAVDTEGKSGPALVETNNKSGLGRRYGPNFVSS